MAHKYWKNELTKMKLRERQRSMLIGACTEYIITIVLTIYVPGQFKIPVAITGGLGWIAFMIMLSIFPRKSSVWFRKEGN